MLDFKITGCKQITRKCYFVVGSNTSVDLYVFVMIILGKEM